MATLIGKSCIIHPRLRGLAMITSIILKTQMKMHAAFFLSWNFEQILTIWNTVREGKGHLSHHHRFGDKQPPLLTKFLEILMILNMVHIHFWSSLIASHHKWICWRTLQEHAVNFFKHENSSKQEAILPFDVLLLPCVNCFWQLRDKKPKRYKVILSFPGMSQIRGKIWKPMTLWLDSLTFVLDQDWFFQGLPWPADSDK